MCDFFKLCGADGFNGTEQSSLISHFFVQVSRPSSDRVQEGLLKIILEAKNSL